MMLKRLISALSGMLLFLFLGFWITMWTLGSVNIALPREPQQPVSPLNVAGALGFWLYGAVPWWRIGAGRMTAAIAHGIRDAVAGAPHARSK